MLDVVDLGTVVAKIALLAECDPDFQVFGASSHRYKLDAPYDVGELESVERDIGCKLPEDYRAFLLEVARAGAGPYYGLIEPGPLMEPIFVREGMPYPRANMPFPFTHETPFDAPLPEGAQRYDGCILLAQQGCGYASLLVVCGPSTGEVWSDFSEGQGPLVPAAPSFLAWIRGWLDGAFYEWATQALPSLARTRVEGAPVHRGVEAARATIERIATTKDPKALRTLGYLRLFEGRFDDALAEFDRARDVGKKEPDARLAIDRCAVFAQRRDFTAILDECERGLESGVLGHGTRSELLYAQEQALWALGRRGDALRVLDTRAESSRWTLDLHHRLARERLRDGDRVGAAAALARAVKLGVGADRGALQDARFKAVCDPFFEELVATDQASDVRALLSLLKTGPN